MYDQESFVTFRSRVLDLALSSIWPGSVTDEITIERLRGGGYNRIIGLTRQGLDGQSDIETEYILRVPRFSSQAKVDNDVAVLQFLHQHTKIPIPQVVQFDATKNNALSSPYMVQNRIPGTDLSRTFPELDHEAKCRVARELGNLFNQMLSVRSSTAGRLVLSNNHNHHEAPIDISSLELTDDPPVRPYSNAPASESVHKVLTAIFLSRKAHSLETWPTEPSRPWFFDQLCRMTSELDTDGWLVNRHYSIAHLDLAPRNIMVNPTVDAQLPIVSGILDWDSAILGPMFLSCAPPLWIWAWQDDEEEDERTANDQPATLEGQELKRCFEEAAGSEYVRLAYEPAYRLARQLVRFALEGLHSHEAFREGKEMLKEWAGIYQSRMQEEP